MTRYEYSLVVYPTPDRVLKQQARNEEAEFNRMIQHPTKELIRQRMCKTKRQNHIRGFRNQHVYHAHGYRIA